MSEHLDSPIVYTGFWYDHNAGGIRGHRFTIPADQAKIVMAALVVVVTITASRSWSLWTIFIHRFVGYLARRGQIATPYSGHGLRQEQVVIRNTVTAGGAVKALMGLAIRERKIAKKPRGWIQTLLIGIAMIHVGAFLAFSLLTSFISVGQTVQSKRTEHCGLWMPGTYSDMMDALRNENLEMIMRGQSLYMNLTLDASNYARTCYRSSQENITSSRRSFGCEFMTEENLPYTTESDTCPFSPEVCSKTGPDSAFAMESGDISFSKLGFNFKGASQIYIRRRTVCAPIESAPFRYSDEAVFQQTGSNESLDIMYSHVLSLPRDRQGSPQNMTTTLTDRELAYPFYDLRSVLAENGNLTHKGLAPQDPRMAVSVVTLHSNAIAHLRPSYDPLFFATFNITSPAGNGSSYLYYMARPTNSVACQEMAMFCSKITNRCTEWRGITGAPVTAPSVVPSSPDPESPKPALMSVLFGDGVSDKDTIPAPYRDAYFAVSLIVRYNLMFSTIHMTVNQRGAQALQASLSVGEGVQTVLAQEQWKVELEAWFTTALARLQRSAINLIKTPNLHTAMVKNMFDEANEPGNWALCDKVLFNSPDHTTLSTFGFAFTMAFALSVVLLRAALPALGKVWGRMHKFLEPWEKDGALELLKQCEPQPEYQNVSTAYKGSDSESSTVGNTQGAVLYTPVYQSNR